MNLTISPVRMNNKSIVKNNTKQSYLYNSFNKSAPLSFRAGASHHLEFTEQVLHKDQLINKEVYKKIALKDAKEEKDKFDFYKDLTTLLIENAKKVTKNGSTEKWMKDFITNNKNIELLVEYLEDNSHLHKTAAIYKESSVFYLKKSNKPLWYRHFQGNSHEFACFSQYTAEYFNIFLEESNKIKLQKTKEKEKEINDKIVLLRKINNAKETLSYDFIEKIVLVKTFKNDEEIENQRIRNSILIEHPDRKVRKDIINWVFEVADCNKLAVKNNETLSLDAFVRKLKTALEHCENIFNEKGIPSIIYVENMSDFISKDIPRPKRGAMKSLLQDCYKKYHSTLIFETNNSKNIDNTSMQPHRTLHIDVLNDPIIERIKNKPSETKLNQNLDGYRMTYGAGSDDCIDLFLGCFGHSKEILWINTSEAKKVNIVLEKLDVIKRNEKFAQIKKLQCPCPKEELSGFYRLNDKTISGEYIYEKNI